MVQVRLANREGVREEPVLRPLKRWSGPEPGGYGTGCSARPLSAADSEADQHVVGGEATRKACGVLVAMLLGCSWTPNSITGDAVNVGTPRRSARVLASQARRGEAHRRLTASGVGGAFVVVGGRESRPHGEGRQAGRSGGAGRSGVRR